MPTPSDAPRNPGLFPLTRFSVLEAMGSGDVRLREDALETLARAYWKPVYKYLRIHWHAEPDDAEDLVQGFFLRAIDTGVFDRFDPGRARFRTWLRLCLDGFVANERKAAARKKRGGDAVTLSLDFEDAEGELRRIEIPTGDDAEAFFRRESARHLFALAITTLRERFENAGKREWFDVFAQYDLAPPEATRPTYQELASRFDVPVTQITNRLHATRRELRGIVLDALRSICGTEREFREEAAELLGPGSLDVDS
jgi:RNA polymerase sigma factor (sigma-70 family)